jgi:hypothetical protein
MNLNKGHKAEIINRIMADIPAVDHTAQAHALLQAKAIEKMPPEVRAVYDKPELRRWLAVRFATHANHLGRGNIIWQREGELGQGTSLYAYRVHYNDSTEDQELVTEVRGPMADLSRAAEEQDKARNSMRDKLITMLIGIRTLKQAKEMLEVELHKYLPVEPPKDAAHKAAQASTALVPYVVANLREMGWPKDQEPSTKEGAN